MMSFTTDKLKYKWESEQMQSQKKTNIEKNVKINSYLMCLWQMRNDRQEIKMETSGGRLHAGG
jgi:hypothetical protein